MQGKTKSYSFFIFREPHSNLTRYKITFLGVYSDIEYFYLLTMENITYLIISYSSDQHLLLGNRCMF